MGSRTAAERVDAPQASDSFGRGRARNLTALPSIAILAILVAAGAVCLVVGPGHAESVAARQDAEIAQASKMKSFEDALCKKAFYAAQDIVSPLTVNVFSRVGIVIANGAVYHVDEATGACDAPVTAIGDSVLEGCSEEFYEIFPQGYLDAAISRQLYTGDEFYEQAKAAGHAGDVVVFALGTNGVATADQVRANIDSADGRRVFLVNVRVPQDLQDMNNALFDQIAAEYDNVVVVDWYSYSAGHDEWFWNDGTHLRPEGAKEYILMLRRAITGQ